MVFFDLALGWLCCVRCAVLDCFYVNPYNSFYPSASLKYRYDFKSYALMRTHGSEFLAMVILATKGFSNR